MTLLDLLDQPDPAPAPRKRKPSLTDKLDDYLRPCIGQWVAVAAMASIVGTSGVRQRRLEVEQRWGVKFRGEYRDRAYGFVIVPPAEQRQGRAA